jgi:HSP20 family protein
MTMMLMPRRNSFFDDFMSDPFELAFPAARTQETRKPITSLMKTDIRETDQAIVIEMELPGVAKENVKAEVENGYLTVTATTEEVKSDGDENGTWLRKERFTGTCRRSFNIGEDVAEEDIHAKYVDGILTITVPKKELLPEPETKKTIAIEG